MPVAFLEEIGLPLGLPLAEVIEVGLVRTTWYMWMLQARKEHNFRMINNLVGYDTEISGYIEKKQIKKLKGVRAKEPMLCPPVGEIAISEPPAGKIHSKSIANISKSFPVEVFAAALVTLAAVVVIFHDTGSGKFYIV
ncbi:hypothetical protein RJ640_003632 [Escallonia rubra]|uniref:Uncharacterized protein n=1 Tax=Escallonia rubra TaxID=112253 RepID=A0AA88UQW0_9ASTE|nr:hypothetical protein RJ640_003632 [Escallonia rubra]